MQIEDVDAQQSKGRVKGVFEDNLDGGDRYQRKEQGTTSKYLEKVKQLWYCSRRLRGLIVRQQVYQNK